MTDQITVPRETWDAMREALEEACGNRCNAEHNPCYAREALTAANAVSEPHARDAVTWTPETGYVFARKPEAQGEAPEFLKVARRKLDGLLADGYQISGYSIERNDAHGTQRGFITAGGFVGWWNAHPQATEPQAVASGITLAQLVQAHCERNLSHEVDAKMAEQIADLLVSDPATEQFLRRLLAGSGTTDTAASEQKP